MRVYNSHLEFPHPHLRSKWRERKGPAPKAWEGEGVAQQVQKIDFVLAAPPLTPVLSRHSLREWGEGEEVRPLGQLSR